MGGFLFENAATRASLKSAFDHLFCKYGREFDDDDEIDLQDLSIVHVGGHVLNEKTRGFGSCYKKPTRNAELTSMDVPVLPEFEQEDNYDDVFVRISGKVKEAQMRRFHEPLTFSPLPPLRPMSLSGATHKTKNYGGVSSKLSRLVLSDYGSTESGSEQEERRRKRPSDDEPPYHSFDEHLWAIIGLEGRHALSELNETTKMCQCRERSCFDCHLINMCLA